MYHWYYPAKGKRIKYVLMKGLIHPTKYSKTTSIKATKEYIIENAESITYSGSP